MADTKLAQMKEAFCLFDRDADGLVDAKDFALIVRSLGINPTQLELDQMLKHKADGMLKFEEFVAIAGNQIKNANQEELLVKAFKTFDREGNGCISSAELKHVMLNLGDQLTAKEVDELVALGDPQGTGNIKYADFAAKLAGKA